MTTRVDPGFMKKVKGLGDQNMEMCFNCSKCTAICPMDTNLLPRSLFRYALLGMTDKIKAEQESIYSCLLCKLCEESCPRGVKIADNVRLLRSYLNRDVFNI
ncbi:MAG: 4Fe-4S dicluster domain-containing protein [bacterium]|jgi:heterodisulfide reductase subunit C2|nr:4Fe-4S dicluster domain-containing protein [bacterium]